MAGPAVPAVGVGFASRPALLFVGAPVARVAVAAFFAGEFAMPAPALAAAAAEAGVADFDCGGLADSLPAAASRGAASAGALEAAAPGFAVSFFVATVSALDGAVNCGRGAVSVTIRPEAEAGRGAASSGWLLAGAEV